MPKWLSGCAERKAVLRILIRMSNYHTEIPLAATGENTHTVSKTTGALLATSKEMGLKVNAEKLSIYSSHNIKTGNK